MEPIAAADRKVIMSLALRQKLADHSRLSQIAAQILIATQVLNTSITEKVIVQAVLWYFVDSSIQWRRW